MKAKPKLVELPSHKSFPPHCCVVSGRRDGELIDFGDPTDKACGPADPRLYMRTVVVEDAAHDLLGMVPRTDVEKLEQQLAQAEAELQRVSAILAGVEELSAAEDKLRAALGVSHEDPGDATDDQEQ